MMIDFIPEIKMPSRMELDEISREWYDVVGFSLINNWPEEWLAQSMKTTLIEVTADDLIGYEVATEGIDYSGLDSLAKRLDDVLGWDQHFIKLASRSPKDSAWCGKSITVSGKQFVNWMISSERCLDDIVQLSIGGYPIYIAVRENRYIEPCDEFRGFWTGDKISIAQYDYLNINKALQNADHRDKIYNEIVEYFEREIKPYGPDHPYVFDVYLDYKHGWRLVEVNPYGLSDPCAALNYKNIEAGGFWYLKDDA